MTRRELGRLVGRSESTIESAEIGRRPLTEENAGRFKLALGVSTESLLPGTDGRVEVCESDRTHWQCEHPGAKREDWTPTTADFESHRRYMDIFGGYKVLVAETLMQLALGAASEADTYPRCRQAVVWNDLVAAVHQVLRRHHLYQFLANAWQSRALQERAIELQRLRRKLEQDLNQETERKIEELRLRFGLPEFYAWHAPKAL